MDYVRLGRTNLEVSRLGLGAMAFGSRRWRDWILEEDEAKAIIDRALDLGINFFDTSDYYSGGDSEAVLGRCLLSRVAREQVVIATKVGNPMGPSATERGYSRKHIIHAADASLKRLGTDYIDLYQTHIWNPTTDLEEMVMAFDHLVRAGKILHAGITTMPAWQFAKCLSIAQRTGCRAFVSAQNHYNLVHREDERELMPSVPIRRRCTHPLQPARPRIPVRRPGRRRRSLRCGREPTNSPTNGTDAGPTSGWRSAWSASRAGAGSRPPRSRSRGCSPGRVSTHRCSAPRAQSTSRRRWKRCR